MSVRNAKSAKQLTVSGVSAKNKSKPTSASSSQEGLAMSSLPTSPTEPSAVEQVMEINRKLVAKIETLRLKVEVDSRHQEKTKNDLLNDKTIALQARDLEIQNLKNDVKKKDKTVKLLEAENAKKGSEIQRLQEHLEELKDDVKMSEQFAKEIQSQLDQMKKEKMGLESGTLYQQKEENIRALQEEVDSLKEHLQTLDEELLKAKDKIVHQGARLRFLELDKNNTQIKFKEELAKASRTMRGEIEKIRSVMHQQYHEMRELREQNKEMCESLREIKELLVENQNTDSARDQQERQRKAKVLPALNVVPVKKR
ncbi:dynactin subunit 1 [Biomphalaria glabrata]|nr:dynactin subunit 1-like [Biomphalaria glabrata]